MIFVIDDNEYKYSVYLKPILNSILNDILPLELDVEINRVDSIYKMATVKLVPINY